MTERVEELLEEILAELKEIRVFIKFEMEVPDVGPVVESIDHLGNRLTGGYDSHPDADLGDVIRAIASVESAIDPQDASPIVEAIGHLGDRLTGGYDTQPDTDLGDVARAIASVESAIDLK